MYRYVEPNQPGAVSLAAPSDNLKINGRYINEVVDGYRQLTVSGRSIVSRDVSTTTIPGRRGVWVDQAQDVAREIEVTFLLKAESSTEFREQYAQLNALLRETQVLSVVFDDEPEYTYEAYFTEADDQAEDTMTAVSRFRLLIPDPYKKKTKQASSGSITLKDAKQVLPDKIVVVTTKESDRVEVKNGEATIALAGSFDAGEKIVFDYLSDAIEVTYKGRSILSAVVLHSPLEEFFLHDGDTITALNAVVQLVEWRDERL